MVPAGAPAMSVKAASLPESDEGSSDDSVSSSALGMQVDLDLSTLFNLGHAKALPPRSST